MKFYVSTTKKIKQLFSVIGIIKSVFRISKVRQCFVEPISVSSQLTIHNERFLKSWEDSLRRLVAANPTYLEQYTPRGNFQ